METRERILVVEDDQVLADLLWRNLKKLQFAVTDVVMTGEEALKKVPENRPDLVLMDIRLGGQLTGIETADKIRKLYNIPVVYVTAYSDKETLDKVKKTEPYGYILKPFDSKDLLIAIEMALYKHKMETRLRQREIWFSTTLKSIGDAVISTDQEGIISFVNPVAEKLTGWTLEEARGKPIDEIFIIISSIGRHRLACPVQSVVSRNDIINYSVPKILVNKEGKEIHIDDSWAPINQEDGRVAGIVLVFRDITERRRFEEDMQKNQKIESIGLLAGGIAHDFNNRLSVILGNAQLAKLNYDKGKDISKYLNNIETSTDQATNLTQQLLTFSKGGEPVKKVCDIKSLIRETSNLSLSGSNDKCVFDIAYDLYPVNVDKGQISQVINNVVINADQAMPDGGIINIIAGNITLDQDTAPQPLTPGKYIKISIIDQGVGIDKEIIHKIFDPYFTTKQKGSGLGLSVAFSIIRKHGGLLSANSNKEEGATFNIFLPAVEEQINQYERDREKAFKGNGKVLVMDDEELVLQMVGDILKGVGYEIELATDGSSAIESYQGALKDGYPFDVVLLDLTVPGGMGGKETVQKLIEIDPGVKAIVSSGYSNDPIMANYRQYGISGVIAKPYRIMELCKTLKSVVEK